jgi:hypothetical protein
MSFKRIGWLFMGAMFGALALWALMTPTEVSAEAPPVQIGEVVVINNYDTEFKVHFRHADQPNRRFATWTIPVGNKQTTLLFNAKKMIIGGNWHIQIEFPNGVISGNHLVAAVGTHGDGEWEITGSDVYFGFRRSAAKWVIPVIVLRYFPIVPNTTKLDLDVTGGPPRERSLVDMMKKCDRITTETMRVLEHGSRFRSYRRAFVSPSLRYEVVKTVDYFERLPLDKAKPKYPDYRAIVERANLRALIARDGVKEVWLWGYHTDTSGLWESNMSSPHGKDVSNSDRDLDDLPIYESTYTVYHYNYHRQTEEAVHNHMHQIECLIRDADPVLAKLFEGEKENWRCGNCHFPPNGLKDYDYHNERVVQSDIEDWRPEGFGRMKPLNRDTWSNSERQWYTYWMQSLPGADNGLVYKNRRLTNWWHLVGNFDNAVLRKVRLIE